MHPEPRKLRSGKAASFIAVTQPLIAALPSLSLSCNPLHKSPAPAVDIPSLQENAPGTLSNSAISVWDPAGKLRQRNSPLSHALETDCPSLRAFDQPLNQPLWSCVHLNPSLWGVIQKSGAGNSISQHLPSAFQLEEAVPPTECGKGQPPLYI